MKKYLFLFLLGIFFWQPAHASYNGYVYQRPLNISSTLVSPINGTTLTNFPVLVSTTFANLKYSSNGGVIQNQVNDPIKGTAVPHQIPADLIFTTDNGCVNTTTWEIENYNSSTGEIEAWVTDASLSQTVGLTLYMCYDNAAVNTFQSTSTKVWAAYGQVFHMNESSSSKTVYDSSPSHANGTLYASTTAQIATSTLNFVDGYFKGNGSGNQSIEEPASFGSGPNFSISFFANIANAQASYFFDSANAGRLILDGGDNAPNSANSISFYDGSAWRSISANAKWPNNTRTFIDYDLDHTNNYAQGFANGTAQQTSTFAANITHFGSNSCLGDYNSCSGGSDIPINGSYDEFRIYNGTTTADWNKTDFTTEASSSLFVSIGAEASSSGGSSSTPAMLVDALFFLSD